ncbi:MAG: formate--tetrahydrofolate ligase [Bacilli bacterium]|jgi:formate--tetrahydrofolate ligase|nr:formate--tetrahydrofolate ligase [Bacilli bacterium]MDD2682393.1 formate--tetrahydrofolate ligase [Bacilli bacterium]MDD3121370.1 formate--tetrahydrofolate ligase [Bacilli bacterium]MDD4063608.1 formate--tetrahydrofolate ligase [Bacilli bacterium]MDD5183585.1 formate--tetrahydrofolate ligase [Bacilli bacterium]
MLTDLEIINAANKVELTKIVKRFKIKEDELFSYGKYMAKVDLSLLERLKNKKDGKLILVTAITPTPTGEGKSTTTVGLVDALNKIGKKAVGALREPSLGPVFGIKGGAAGGGYAQVNPMVELNLHFTGDLHAITTANNLVSAIIDNYLYQGNPLNIDPSKITWKRCIDLNDRALRLVNVGLSSKREVVRQDEYNISVASEIMASFCLSSSLVDLRNRLDRTIVAYNYNNEPITIKDLKITGSLLVLLKDALKPNIVQTLENNLFFVHGGPFANIAHGCNSVLATKTALKIADYVVTEAGFGADLGAEKFFDIKCREAGLNPNVVVIVATIKALKYHGGKPIASIKEEGLNELTRGLANLERHIQTINTLGVNSVVAINKFDTDTDAEISLLKAWAKENNIVISLSEVYAKGSLGGIDLANKVVENISRKKFKPIYNISDDLFKKVDKLCKKVYGANKIEYSEEAKDMLKKYDEKYRDFYICMAKTPVSLTDNPKTLGIPKDHTIHINEIRLATGSNFIICLTGNVMTMPGLGKDPMAFHIDVLEDGTVVGLS